MRASTARKMLKIASALGMQHRHAETISWMLNAARVLQSKVETAIELLRTPETCAVP